MTKAFYHQYLASYRPFKPYWNYEDGCVLLGCEDMFYAFKDSRYADFILEYLSPRISQDGTISDYPASRYSLDSFNSCKLLFLRGNRQKKNGIALRSAARSNSSGSIRGRTAASAGTREFIRIRSGWTAALWLHRSLQLMRI